MSIKTVLSREPAIFLFQKLWFFSYSCRIKIIQYVAMFLIANCILLATPLLFGMIIGEVQTNDLSSQNLSYLIFLLFLLASSNFFFWLLHGPARVIERTVSFEASNNYRHSLLQRVLDLRIDWHGSHDSGDTIDKVNKAGDGLLEFGETVFQIIEIIVKLVGTSIVLFWFSPWIGTFVFVFIILSFLVVFQFDKRLVPQYRKLNEFSNKALASVFDALSNITTIKILNIEKPVLSGVMARFKASKLLYQKNAILNEWKWFSGLMLFHSISFTTLAFYFYSQVKMGNKVDVGTISTLYLYLSDLIVVFFNFGSRYEILTIYKNRLVNAEPIEHAFLEMRNIQRRAMPSWKNLEIHHLTFSYNGIDEVANLNQVSLKVRFGERIAVIGESGSGKTTFLKVLHGMYPTAHGYLSLDGNHSFSTSFADIDLKTMLVPQEPEIFSSTIRDNTTLGVAYDDTQVMLASKIAAFDKVVHQLPKGLDSVINEKGVNLSGGQKQRLALTRALLFAEDKDIVLLDESTSSVDPENEIEIYKNIWQAFHDKTIIASIHKMNLLKFFDRIVMFDKNRIVDEGTFDELLSRNKFFKTGWKKFVSTQEF